MDKVIQIKNFSKSFGKTQVIKNISFDVTKGEVFAFLGANGSGKTTTLRTLLNIYQPDKGELLINGQRFDLESTSQLGYLPEERGLYLNMQVLETLVYFGTLKGLEKREATKRAKSFLERVDLADKANLQVKSLSSGQQQKIQLGITIIHNPSILILDEPTKGLDPVNRRLLLEILEELREQGATILFSTHIMSEAEELADRLCMLKNGELALYGSIKEIKDNYSSTGFKFTANGEVPTSVKKMKIKKVKNDYIIEDAFDLSETEIIKELIQENVQLTGFQHSTPTLEEIFIKVSKE